MKIKFWAVFHKLTCAFVAETYLYSFLLTIIFHPNNPLAKISISDGLIRKILHERRDYESADKKSLS